MIKTVDHVIFCILRSDWSSDFVLLQTWWDSVSFSGSGETGLSSLLNLKTFDIGINSCLHNFFQMAPAKFECVICGKSFTKRNSLNRHIRTIHHRESTKCEFCGHTFPRKDSYLRHVISQHQRGSGQARGESKTFNKAKENKNEEKSQPQTDFSPFENDEDKECASNEKEKEKEQEKEQEQENVNGNLRKFPKDENGHRSRQKQYETRRQIFSGSKSSISAKAPSKYKCELCGTYFTRQSVLDRHVRTVHDGMFTKCELCEQTFSRKDNYLRHLKLKHPQDGGLVREESEKSNRTNANDNEVKLQTDNHVSSEIDLLSNKTNNVTKMKKTHPVKGHSDPDNEEVLKGITEDEVENINEHLRTYSDDENGQRCVQNQCDSRLQISGSTSQLSATTPAEFECEFCGKYFTKRKVLNRHIRTVHEGKSTTCEICGLSFNRKDSYLRHLKFKHQQDDGLVREESTDKANKVNANDNEEKSETDKYDFSENDLEMECISEEDEVKEEQEGRRTSTIIGKLFNRRKWQVVISILTISTTRMVSLLLDFSIDRTVRNQNLTKYTTYPCPHPNPVTTMTSDLQVASSTVTQKGELGNTITTTVTETVGAGDEVISTDVQNGGHDDTTSVNPTGNPYEPPVSTVEPIVDTDFVTNDVDGHLETTSSSHGETTLIKYQTSTPVSESITTEGSNLNVVGTAKQSVNTREITAQSVPTGNITAHSVTSDEITTQSVTSDEITTQSVTSDEITTQSVTSGEITTKSVTSGEITTQSVTSGEITTQSVQVISVETTTQSLNTGGIRTHSVSTNEITTQRVHTLEVTTQSVDFVDTISQSVNTGEVSKQSVSTDETTSQIVNIGDVTTQRVNIDETVTLSAHTSETVSTTDYERATSYISDTVSFDTATNVFSDSPSPEVEISTNQNNEVGLSTLPPFNNTHKPYCHCSCKDIGNLTESLLQKKIQDMKDNLSLTKGNLSSVRRTKVSAHDARISSQSAGYVATAILATISALFIIIDLSNIVHFCIR
ncbi:hypothetical protein FSP39_022640 [Pinctada imbricata]|uniref:C2H2-type domain-containing protein n=1 Tax=Pinctada imbricata TaxID=66713 RepID=A0AA88YJF5_PINIB|nr:hypothetical protein FSP39_022640 [Pinctada imbricata]